MSRVQLSWRTATVLDWLDDLYDPEEWYEDLNRPKEGDLIFDHPESEDCIISFLGTGQVCLYHTKFGMKVFYIPRYCRLH